MANEGADRNTLWCERVELLRTSMGRNKVSSTTPDNQAYRLSSATPPEAIPLAAAPLAAAPPVVDPLAVAPPAGAHPDLMP
jgi:hypothetical protein